MTIYTIEVNLDQDFACHCSWHIDDEKSTILRNLRQLEEKEKDRWVVVGFANSLSEAHDKSKKLQLLLCEKAQKKPYGMDALLQKIIDADDLDEQIK